MLNKVYQKYLRNKLQVVKIQVYTIHAIVFNFSESGAQASDFDM